METDLEVVMIAGDKRTVRLRSMDVANNGANASAWVCFHAALRKRLTYMIPETQLRRRISSRIKAGRWQTIFVAGIHPKQVAEVTAIVHQELATYGITLAREPVPERWRREANAEYERTCCSRASATRAR